MKDINEISQEEKMMDAPKHILSPDAAPFHPAYEPVNIAIFNDGVPSLTVVSETDRVKLLNGIADDALDEGFPPDALEAAELEAADDFVETMANLSLMEEREERARESFVHIKKRFEVRREEGLVGRPKSAKHLVDPVSHLQPTAKTNSLVQYSHAHRMLTMGDKLRTHETARRSEPRSKKTQVPRHAIQQPRKHN